MIKVLGIESSCDDSAASVVTCQKNILSNVVLSQHKDHMPFQGIVPEIAARKHLDNLQFCIKSALELSGCRLADIDAIGVTAGPGLIGGLIVGVMYAKGLAHVAAKPVIQINHLEGHILTARLTNNAQYPYLVLLVSGGHTQFVSVKNIAQYKVIGQTLDDAVGECFDKTAKILGLQYPGGPAVEKMAQNGDPAKYALPLSMVGRAGADLSFSGLKTATRMLVEKLKSQQGLESFVPDVCASFQYTIAKILAMRTLNAIAMLDYVPSSLILAGGVAANLFIRSYLQRELGLIGIELIAPPVNLCTDNGAMISWAAIERLQNNLLEDENASLNPSLSLL